MMEILEDQKKDARIAELEARAEHDEDNLEGLQHALVRANQRYTQAEAELDKWEWVARDACRELAYETHVNPQSPLDYRLAHYQKGTP